MSKLLKIKITEVAQVTRTRIVEVESDEPFGSTFYDLDNGDVGQLDHITKLVREQHSVEGDMTEQVIKAQIL